MSAAEFAEAMKADNVESGHNEEQFSVNVVNLSYRQGGRIIRKAINDFKTNLAEYTNVGWVLANFQDFGKNTAGANLFNVNFKVNGGELTAVLGKKEERREVIDFLAGRKKSGTFSGDISMRGGKLTKSSRYFDNCTFVQGKPLYIPGLTYMEMLRYSAKLKMKPKDGVVATSLMVEERINDLLVTMNISKCRSRRIPSMPETRGEIGGDLRRLSIALELVDLPPLIVIDEPTLEFDPAISVGIMQCLLTLSRRGHAVVCSMSKPCLQVFAQLDRIVLLSEGYSIFCAPPKEAEEYFCGPLMSYELKKGVDLVEFVMDIASGIERPTTQRTADLPSVMVEKFESTELFEQPKSGDVTVFSPDYFFLLGYARFDTIPHILYRTLVVIQRAFHTKFKDIEGLQAGIFGAAIISTLCGYLQFNQGTYGQYAVSILTFPYLNTANLSSLFFFITAFSFAFPFTQAHVICQKLQLFRYEQSQGCCTIAAFIIATVLSEVPFLASYVFIFINIIYFMADLAKGYYNYGWFVQTVEVNCMIGLTSAYLLSSIFKKELVVRDMFFLMLTFAIMLSGFPFQLPAMTSYLADASCVNPLRWTFEGLMQWKFSAYVDGKAWLTPFGFENFNHEDLINIQKNFILIANSVTILFLISDPCFLQREVKEETSRMTRASRGSTGSEDGLDTSHLPRNSSRQSQVVKPVIFMRDSSVTGRASKLSINLSQVGEENSDHGPTVMFKDITYRVPDRSSPVGYKTILNRVSGQFDWGKLSVIMGASESGKSSLLRIVAGETGAGTQVTGKVLFNNLSPDPTVPLWARCGLVGAHDEHLRDLTVREVLTFAMKLRCFNRLGLKVVAENVDKTLEILHLGDCANKKTKKLTPGELKRLSIAEEMVHGPKLLFADEPTTGVNAEESAVLLQCFRELVNQDRTVVTTVHQPSAEIFKLFDTLLLLSKGRVIYFGPVGGATKFFNTSPFQFNITNYTNPADFLADISGGFISDSKGDFVDSSLLENFYMQSESYNKLRMRFKPLVSPAKTATANPMFGARKVKEIEPSKNISLSSQPDESVASIEIEVSGEPSSHKAFEYPSAVVNAWECIYDAIRMPNGTEAANMIFKGGIIGHRAFLALGNRIELLIASTVLHILLGCMFGWIIGNASGITGVYNFTSYLAIASLLLIIANIQFVYYVFNNHQVFLKENHRGLYTNFVQWLVSHWPLYLLRTTNAIFFVLSSYPIFKLPTVAKTFGFVVLIFIFLTLTSTMMAEFCIVGAPEKRIAYLTIPALAFFNFLFSGLFIKPGSLPEWLAPWAPSLSMIRWTMQSNFINQYDNNPDVFPVLHSGYNTYTSFLQLFGWGGKTKWYCFYMLIANVFIFKAVGLLASGLSVQAQKGIKKSLRNVEH